MNNYSEDDDIDVNYSDDDENVSVHKIESFVIYYFYSKMDHSELMNKKQYIVYLTAYKEDKLINFYKGTFRGLHSIKNNIIFINVIEHKTYPEEIIYLGHRVRQTALIRNDVVFFPKGVYTFHSVDEVKENGKKAIQNMDKRSLDMILKRLVNEHFEW